jgi:serine/threonine protein kinase
MGNNVCRKPENSDRKVTTVQHKISSANLIKSEVELNEVVLSDFKKVKLLGEGGFGKVFLVEKKLRGLKKYYAMKVLQKEFIMQNDQFEHVMAER